MNAQPATHTQDRIPRWLVRAIGASLIILLVGVTLTRLLGYSPTVAPGAVVAQRTLHFADGSDGAVLVRDVATGETLAEMRGEQGFLRGVLRGMARERRLQTVGSAPPYVLSLHADGRFLLSDPETGQRIDLASFGHDNAAVFLRWMPAAALQALEGVPTR